MSIDAQKLGRTATVVLLAALATAPIGDRLANAYALEGPKWGELRVGFRYVIPGANSATLSTAFRQAMLDWNPVSAFKYVVVNSSANPCATSGANGGALMPTDCGQAFGSGVLAITAFDYNPSTNRMTHAGTAFNSHVNFSVYAGALKPSTMDFRRVAVHELGHALGMAHENNPNIPAIMAPTISNVQKPQPDDINGVRAMYGPPG